MSQGFIVPTLIAMRYRIMNLEGSNILLNYKRSMLDVIKKRFGRYFEVTETSADIYLAAVTLPQFKLSFTDNVLDQQKIRDLLRNECANFSTEQETPSEIIDATAEVDDFFVCFSHNNGRRNSIENEFENEVSRYLNDHRTDYKMLNDYPTIRKLYFKFNTTLSSSASVERMFSRSKLVYRPQRNRLSADHFEQALMLNVNGKMIDF